MRIVQCSRILLVIFIVSSLSANEAVVEYRHESMEAIGVHFDAIKKIVAGELPFEDHIIKHASALADYAEMMPDLFEEGSEGGETLDRVWEEPDKFQEALENFQETAAALNDVAEESEEEGEDTGIMKAFQATGNACKGCHRRYRE